MGHVQLEFYNTSKYKIFEKNYGSPWIGCQLYNGRREFSPFLAFGLRLRSKTNFVYGSRNNTSTNINLNPWTTVAHNLSFFCLKSQFYSQPTHSRKFSHREDFKIAKSSLSEDLHFWSLRGHCSAVKCLAPSIAEYPPDPLFWSKKKKTSLH